ncbi:hypothetical protein LCR01_09860 [Companilactobacillus crustorum]|uniref:Transposase n=1 Tax=Companilactobacillus crustorum TaxID=392416 RepID=A0AB34AB70_9LACO|nr:hypothetical protein LCR01_09860 [Companilactobacillus crustorum]
MIKYSPKLKLNIFKKKFPICKDIREFKAISNIYVNWFSNLANLKKDKDMTYMNI